MSEQQKRDLRHGGIWFGAGLLVVGGAWLAVLGVAMSLLTGGLSWVAELGGDPQAMLAVLVVGVLCVGALRHRFAPPGATMAGRMVAVRGHAHGRHRGGHKHRASRHEAGHAAAARRLGRLRSAEVYDDGTGLVQAWVPDAEAAIAFLLAGQIAHGSGEGAGGDNAAVSKTLREFPAGERAAVRARATATARRIVRQDSGRIRRDERTLNTRGQL